MEKSKDELVAINTDPSLRTSDGKFKKGNKVRPYTPSGKKKDYSPILRAVAENAYTPEQITDLVHEMVDIAREAGDWKGIYAAVSFILAYSVGKPVQRSITASMDVDTLRAFLLEEEVRDDGGGVIEIDGGAVDGGDVGSVLEGDGVDG